MTKLTDEENPPVGERPSGVIEEKVGGRVAKAIKTSTFRADVKWFVATIAIGVGAYAKIDANAQSKVDKLERKQDLAVNRVEGKVDALLIGLNIPFPKGHPPVDAGE